MPRLALLLLCAAYVLPGMFGRDPWRNADITAFGYMLSHGRRPQRWLAPVSRRRCRPMPRCCRTGWAPPSSSCCRPGSSPALAARLPFALLLALVLSLTWYSTFHLARTEAAQPVAFAFGGEADPVDYARAIADGAVLALIATLGLLQLGHETTPETGAAVRRAACSFGRWRRRPTASGAPGSPRWRALVLVAGSGAPFVALGHGPGRLRGLRLFAPTRRCAGWCPGWRLGTLAAAWLAMGAGRLGLARRMAHRPAATCCRSAACGCGSCGRPGRWRCGRCGAGAGICSTGMCRCRWSRCGVALACSFGMGGSDRALMLGLPGAGGAGRLCAAHAATAAPPRRIDWFSMFLFTLCAGALWVIYLSVQTGVPAKPAANVATPGAGLRAAVLAAGAAAGRWSARWPGSGWCAGAPGATARRCGRAWCCRPAAWRCAGCC